MADNNSEEHVFRLSSIDQAARRVYLRYCLCFSCLSNTADIESITKRLTATIKRTVTQLPILAGSVRPASEDGPQKGRLEVFVTLENVHRFLPSIEVFSQEEIGHTYQDLARARMPPSTLIDDKFAPLSDIPDSQTAAVFAVKASFLPGGVIVALYLHHSVADVVGLGTVVCHLSSDLPSCKLSNSELKDDAVEQSRLRDRLSGSRGAKAGPRMAVHPHTRLPSLDSALKSLSLHSDYATCRVLSFNLKFLDELKNIANERLHFMHNDRSIQLSTFDVLTTILWKGVSRARFSRREPAQSDSQYDSPLLIPVDIRTLIEPQLDDSYLGNAEVTAISTSPALRLLMPFDAGTIAHTAHLVHNEIATICERSLRSVIAGINEQADLQSAPINQFNPDLDLLITSWADLPLENAHLGLGLGTPSWIRKVGRTQTTDGCIIHPVRWEEGLCEVTVELDEETMKVLLEDENFMAFVVHVV